MKDMAKPTIIVVGAGQAGLQLVASLREARYEGRLVLVGDESHPPYQRPPLSKGYLLDEVALEQVNLRPAHFFNQHNIELLTGKQVVAIDRSTCRVIFSDTSALTYDHLVLSTGARNRLLSVPGADLQNVLYLRSLDDARSIKAQMAPGQRAVVIGAGFIGLELAASAVKHRLDVTVVELAGRPMARAISERMSSIFVREHENMGVKLCFHTQVARIRGENACVSGVETVDGRVLPADLVLVGIGVLPNVELAVGCDLLVDDGIVVDEHLLTSDPQISAIGDVAAHANAFAAVGVASGPNRGTAIGVFSIHSRGRMQPADGRCRVAAQQQCAS